MKRKLLYLILFLIAVSIRLLINFKFDLLPGANGGYYPLQVRCLLTNGHLGFSDMPLYFYFNAFLVKCASLFTDAPSNSLIMRVVKTSDSFFLPLLLIPLFGICKALTKFKLPFYQEYLIAAFAVISISPLILTGDLQKNGFAIPLLFTFFLFGIQYLIAPSKRILLLTLLFFVLTGITHFGTFAVGAITLIICLIFYKGKKALIPIMTVGLITVGLIAIFDTTRALRFVNVLSEIFIHPSLFKGLPGPPGILNYLFSYALIGTGIHCLKKQKEKMDSKDRVIIITLTILVFILSFPLLNVEYAKRLTLMLFVPQSILMMVLFMFTGKPMKAGLIIFALLIMIFGMGVLRLKKPVITSTAYAELIQLKEYIPVGDNTLVIARHGLEWWIGWALQTKIGNEKGIDQTVLKEYENVIFIHQKKGVNELAPGGKDLFYKVFKEPNPPFGKLNELYTTEFYSVYEWNY